MTKYTPTTNRLKESVLSLHKYFKRTKRLQADGSFFQSDKQFADRFKCNLRTIKRARQQLKEYDSEIEIQSGKYKGVASYYWVLVKDDNMTPIDYKDDKLSCEDDKLSGKGCQNVPPNRDNKDLNKKCFKTGDHIFLAVIQFLNQYEIFEKDYVLTKDWFLNQGYTEQQIEEAYRKSGKKSLNSN